MTSSTLKIITNMTIYEANDLKVLLQSELAKASSLAIDLSAVCEIDTTGLQLLLALRRDEKSVTLVNPNHCIKQLTELLQLQDLLGFELANGVTSL